MQDSNNTILSPYSTKSDLSIMRMENFVVLSPSLKHDDISEVMHQSSHNMQQQSLSRSMLLNNPLKMMNYTSDFEPTPLPPNHQHQNVVTSGAPHSNFNKKRPATCSENMSSCNAT
eukprot:1673591-Ditylum_brightwellii.AAC.1